MIKQYTNYKVKTRILRSQNRESGKEQELKEITKLSNEILFGVNTSAVLNLQVMLWQNR